MPSLKRSTPNILDNHYSTEKLPTTADIVIIRKLSILVPESRQPYSGATGRNVGHLKSGSYAFIAKLAQKSANVAAVADFIRQEKIDCDFRRLKEGYENLVAVGIESTKATFCAPEQHAEQLSGIKGAKGMLSYTAGHVRPYKLIHHLFADAIAQGVNAQTNTSSTSISSSHRTWVIETPRGEIHANQVIMATNAYTASLLPEFTDKIIPY
ncbi:hypothetical protein CEP52_005857 [Fusarium oligoseptatum]|uniref:FAD dependent oxidoreductase domain-containing protein n=1 Tax=Fusarium oligoseptatum TaxID=2604345 RepID=A0A428TW34_9HYPO|nr:hypothetical protein CEP52_005857 [Fusarium oligoseptatum]